MASNTNSKKDIEKSERAPAMSVESHQNQMISLANKCAEDQLRKGTASSQIICHYLKLGSEKEKLSIEREKAELELVKAKTKAIQSSERMESMFAKALSAFSSYRGEVDAEEEDDDEEELYGTR